MRPEAKMEELFSELVALEEKRRQERSGRWKRLTKAEQKRREQVIAEIADLLKQAEGPDRRRFLRIPGSLEVRFQMHAATLTCTASDLSLGGLTLQSYAWQALEDKPLTVESFRVQGEDFRVSIPSKMVWKMESDGKRAGLQFSEVDGAAERQIHAVFEKLLLIHLGTLFSAGAS